MATSGREGELTQPRVHLFCHPCIFEYMSLSGYHNTCNRRKMSHLWTRQICWLSDLSLKQTVPTLCLLVFTPQSNSHWGLWNGSIDQCKITVHGRGGKGWPQGWTAVFPLSTSFILGGNLLSFKLTNLHESPIAKALNCGQNCSCTSCNYTGDRLVHDRLDIDIG